ncbi:hypothetical protein KAFR_0B02150 [Kazachstania africana CBS 2517]|uniref:Arf-GAP domain-containing protein n=1 Tax=Kazachstania africana (strain ATCC 22294 / BCRC 22015 / CBS 2517 / CECT 1963 / NBRC 1671 / NRRL Y-8276) TaxID=1071382 RepID=H2AQ63_KAZAF|nr:hypothetical protein KAFR_0B02150 [Kazachstania africana CBS 2517]CCF56513.1 hypothetical protein KAFR_0B02150 [Kazachstania africana CBS 2517]
MSDYQSQLQRCLHSPPHNNQCSDCKALNPTWCSTTFNVFLCTRCASLHKKILNKDPYYSNIKSITLDYWNQDDLYNLIDFRRARDSTIKYDLYTISDNNYDIEKLIEGKYMDPLMKKDRMKKISRRKVGKLPLLTNRRARDYEIGKFAAHIRQVRSMSSKFYTEDNIIEALSLSHGNIQTAVDILEYNDTSNVSDDDDNDFNAPTLPKRPDTTAGPRAAVFDGNSVAPTSSNQPKTVVFDGLDTNFSQQMYPQQTNYSQNSMQTGYQQPFSSQVPFQQQQIQQLGQQTFQQVPVQPTIQQQQQPMFQQQNMYQQPTYQEQSLPVQQIIQQQQQPLQTQQTFPQAIFQQQPLQPQQAFQQQPGYQQQMQPLASQAPTQQVVQQQPFVQQQVLPQQQTYPTQAFSNNPFSY